MINLKIDPEFQSQIPPLTDDEFKQLEENILKEGKLLSPLIVWNNILVDGHNRYEIVQEHPEISFSTMPLPFESREEVLAWICKNQLGRRNLTPEQKYYLMGKQYEAEKAAHGGDRKSSDAKSSSLNANLIDSTKTCDRIAEENGVSKDTVIRASKYMKGVEIAEELMPGLKQSILSGQMKVSKADMHRLARAAYNDRAQTLQDILHPELKVEPKPDADGVIRVPGKAPVTEITKTPGQVVPVLAGVQGHCHSSGQHCAVHAHHIVVAVAGQDGHSLPQGVRGAAAQKCHEPPQVCSVLPEGHLHHAALGLIIIADTNPVCVDRFQIVQRLIQRMNHVSLHVTVFYIPAAGPTRGRAAFSIVFSIQYRHWQCNTFARFNFHFWQSNLAYLVFSIRQPVPSAQKFGPSAGLFYR